jgi:hypothetical protein
MAVERGDIDWMREIAEEKAGGRTASFAKGHQSGTYTPAAKGQGATPAQTVTPAPAKKRFGFL